jgi:hypothetical protein
VPDGKDPLRNRFLLIRYLAFAMIFAAVLISLGYGGHDLLGLVGPLLLLGAAGGSVSLHLGWASSFRFLYGFVTIMAAFWAQLGTGTPFYVGWAVLILGMASVLLGGVSLETRYLRTVQENPGLGVTGLVSLRKAMLRTGTYLLIVTVVSLLVVLSSFAFVLGTFPIWAVGTCTAVLVLMFAYLVSKSAEATGKSG